MIGAALFTLFFCLVCLAYGKGCLWLAGRLLGADYGEQPPAAWTALLGCAAVTTLAAALSLWLPLSWGALTLATAGAALIAFGLRRSPGFFPARAEFKLPGLALPVLLVVCLGILENSTHLPANGDTGLYHAQAIRWLETFPAVPGLGNLHGRLAFNSSWLATNALFSFAFFGGQSFHLAPAALVSLAAWIFVQGLAGWLKGDASPANILKSLLLPLLFYLMGSEFSSPGTDLPAILVSWLLAVGWLERRGRSSGLDVVLFSLSILAAPLKLSAAPLGLFAVGLGLAGLRRRARTAWVWGALAGVILLPWVARNLVLSGYPLYPLPGVPGLNVDWRIPAEKVREEQRSVLAWGRFPGEDRGRVLARPAREWLPEWFRDQTLNRRGMLLLALLAPLLLGLEWGWARWKRRPERGALAALFAPALPLYGGLFYWLLSAPDFRFGYGYLGVLLLLPLVYPLMLLSGVSPRLRLAVPAAAAGFILAYQLLFLLQSFEPKTFPQRIVLPLAYPVLPSQPCAIQNGAVLCAAPVSWTLCWYEPFPCIPGANPDVLKRGPGWGDGFRY